MSQKDDVADADANHYVQEVRNFAAEENAEVIVVSARAEEEIAELDEEDKSGIFRSFRNRRIRFGSVDPCCL